MMPKFFRPLLGRLILLLDWCTRPRPHPRSEQELKLLARDLRGLALYSRRDCPACIRLRRQVRHWNVPLELRDIRKSQVYHDDLLAGVGRPRTPCLRVEESGGVRWILEPEEIAAYLGERFRPDKDRRAA